MPSITVRSDNLTNIKIGALRASFNASGTRILRYYIDLTHNILQLHKEISAPEIEILQQKVDILVQGWDKRYDLYLVVKQRADGKALADEATLEAEWTRSRLRNLLKHTLSVDDAVDWDQLKPNEKYIPERFPRQFPKEPSPTWKPSEPEIGIFDRIFGGARRKWDAHIAELKRIEAKDSEALSRFREERAKWYAEEATWDSEQAKKRDEHDARQAELHAEVDRLCSAWATGDPQAIIEHATLVLDSSEYPDLVQKDFDLSFDTSRGIMVVDYQLPLPDALPLAKVVRYNNSTGELSETQISKSEAKDLYDSVCYQICLRTIHELLEADVHAHIKSIAFNGIAHSIDPATGKESNSVLMSILIEREQFLALNLAIVEPKSCFKGLKGVSASSLAGLAPVPPVLQINKEDRRFIEGREIDIGEEGITNLAAMSWEDFEHLVRELFEKEFASRGGEVRVTQASADGGVDAVAFDPDPISGGKIVIQAKRYTRTVGVGAVRDLYGTTQAEGATKGILVTTSDYGPDAYRFAQGKPLTLLTGANLLHLMERHGMRATINIAQARSDLGLSPRH